MYRLLQDSFRCLPLNCTISPTLFANVPREGWCLQEGPGGLVTGSSIKTQQELEAPAQGSPAEPSLRGLAATENGEAACPLEAR